VFNCSACTDDPYGVCGYPTCSSYTCGQAYDNGVGCATCKTCSSGSCSSFVPYGIKGLNCTGLHYGCSGTGTCIYSPCSYCNYVAPTAGNNCTTTCANGGWCACCGACTSGECTTYTCSSIAPGSIVWCLCRGWTF